MIAQVNPYALADRRQAAARARLEGRWLRRLWPLAALALLPLLHRAGWYRWLELEGAARADGAANLAFRIGVVLTVALALGTYDTVVRGPDRGVVDLHPLLPRPYLRARLRMAAEAHGEWLAFGLLLVAPAASDPRTGLGLAGVLAGAWVAGLGLGLGINLGAARLARSPAWAGLLDVVRGSNPREQAPFLYAPGLAVTLAAASVLGATEALRSWIAGGVPWGFALPLLAGGGGLGLAFWRAPDLAGLPAVLGEIDARWAGVESEEDARRVYLEWVADRAPAAWREELRKALRHGWRGHRSLVLGAWGAGAFAAAVVLAEGPGRTGLAAVAAMALTGLLGPRLKATDPPLLDLLYRRPGVGRARALAVALWILPAGLLPLCAGRELRGLGLALLAALLVPVLAARLGLRAYGLAAMGLVALAAAFG